MTDNTARAAKIAALLAKAERTDNEHERDAFSAAAERLMMQWGIDDAMAAAAAEQTGAAPEQCIRTDEFIGGSYYHAWQNLAVVIQNNMKGIRIVLVANAGKSTIAVVGTQSDTERYLQLFRSLKAQAKGSMETWWAPQRGTGNGNGFKIRRQFLLSFVNGASERLRNEWRETVEQTAGAELVLVSRDQRAQVAVRQMFPSVRSSRHASIRGGGEDARAAGYAAGQRASFGPRRQQIG